MRRRIGEYISLELFYVNNNNKNSIIILFIPAGKAAVVRSHNEEHISIILSHRDETLAHTHFYS